jgi:hypothetical protein
LIFFILSVFSFFAFFDGKDTEKIGKSMDFKEEKHRLSKKMRNFAAIL